MEPHLGAKAGEGVMVVRRVDNSLCCHDPLAMPGSSDRLFSRSIHMRIAQSPRALLMPMHVDKTLRIVVWDEAVRMEVNRSRGADVAVGGPKIWANQCVAQIARDQDIKRRLEVLLNDARVIH